MPIVSSDIHFRISGAASGNGPTSAGATGSLGFFMSSTDIVNNTINNLFVDETGDNNALQLADYRCVFIYNAHAGITLQNAYVWLSGQRFTATSASPAVFTANSHGFTLNEIVRIDAEYVTDSLPTGFTNSTTYYVIAPTTNTFQLATSANGSAVNSTSTGTGAVRQYGITTCSIALDNKGVVLASGGTVPPVPQATGIPTPTGIPTGVGAFSSPTTKLTGLSLGNIQASGVYGIWVKRLATNSAAANNDGCTLQVNGDTTA